MRKIRIMTTVTIGICPIVESSSSGGLWTAPPHVRTPPRYSPMLRITRRAVVIYVATPCGAGPRRTEPHGAHA